MDVDGTRVIKTMHREKDLDNQEFILFKRTSADLVLMDGDTDLSGANYINAGHIQNVMQALIELDIKLKALADATGNTI